MRVQVPFFQPIAPTEEVIKSTDDCVTPSGGYLTQKITEAADHDDQHRGFGYAVDDLSSLGTGADPMAAIRSYLTRAILKLRTSTCWLSLTVCSALRC